MHLLSIQGVSATPAKAAWKSKVLKANWKWIVVTGLDSLDKIMSFYFAPGNTGREAYGLDWLPPFQSKNTPSICEPTRFFWVVKILFLCYTHTFSLHADGSLNSELNGRLVRRSLGHFESKICVFTAWLEEAQRRNFFFLLQKGVCRECYASLMRMSVRLAIAPFRNGRQQLTGVGRTLHTWETDHVCCLEGLGCWKDTAQDLDLCMALVDEFVSFFLRWLGVWHLFLLFHK